MLTNWKHETGCKASQITETLEKFVIMSLKYNKKVRKAGNEFTDVYPTKYIYVYYT